MNYFKNLNFKEIKPFLNNRKRNYLIVTQTATAFIGLISGKLIAVFILPEQFGLYNLQFAIFTFFFSLLISPSIQFLKATYYNYLPKVGIRFYLVSFAWLSVISFVLIFSFFALYKPESNLDPNLLFIILILVPISTTSKLLTDQFNVLDRINKYSTHSIVGMASGLAFLVVVFFVFPGINKNYIVLWAMQLVMAAAGVMIFIKDFRFVSKIKPPVSYQIFLTKHFRFTLPLMFLAIWTWANNYFDRFVIEYFMQLNDVGIYNANYGVGSKFFLLINPIFLVLLTPLVYQNNTIAFKKEIIRKYVTYYLVLGIFLLILIYLFRELIGSLLLSQQYSDGFYLIFWIALAFFLFTATYLYESILFAEQKTRLILYSNILGAILNIALNLILIPVMGLIGAACATITSAFARFIFIYFKFAKL